MRLAFSFSIRIRLLCAAFALAWFLLVPNVAIGDDNCGSIDRLTIALRVIRALHPVIKGREVSISLSAGHAGGLPTTPTDADDLRIAIDRPAWHPPVGANGQADTVPQSSPAQSSDVELPLYFYFSFIKTGTVKRQLACRPLTFMSSASSKLMEKAWAAINAHPEWSDGEALAAARQYGMRFGPSKKAAIVGLIPLKALSTFYGPLRIKSVQFDIYDAEKCAGCSFADLRWYITAEKVGTRETLQIMAEPFRGKIVAITE
jgi:hypothetical protein